jgi:ABC-2 type transport system permease protein
VAAIAGAHHEDVSGRTELALSTATSRLRWFSATATIALSGTAWLLLVAAGGLWAGYVAAGGGAEVSSAVPAALGWVPAAGLVAAVGLLGLGLRAPWLGWGFFVLSMTLTLVGELLELPVWVQRISPYSAVPIYPLEPWQWTPVIVLTALVAAVSGLAWLLFSQRDVS